MNKSPLNLVIFALLNQGIDPSFANPLTSAIVANNTSSLSSIKLETAFVLANKTDEVHKSSTSSSEQFSAENIGSKTFIDTPYEIKQPTGLLADNTEPPIEEEYPGGSTQFPNPFGLNIPLNRSPYDFSQKKHCDVLRHLKVPATPRDRKSVV